MGKRRKKKRECRRLVPGVAAETVPGALEAYLADPIALWQDGEYEALDALYAESNGTTANPCAETRCCHLETMYDDDAPF